MDVVKNILGKGLKVDRYSKSKVNYISTPEAKKILLNTDRRVVDDCCWQNGISSENMSREKATSLAAKGFTLGDPLTRMSHSEFKNSLRNIKKYNVR